MPMKACTKTRVRVRVCVRKKESERERVIRRHSLLDWWNRYKLLNVETFFSVWPAIFFQTLCVHVLAVSTWRMAPRPAAAPWTRRRRPALAWSSTQTSPATASGGSPSSTAPTATTTCPPNPCPETPPSPLNCEYRSHDQRTSVPSLSQVFYSSGAIRQ